MDISNSPNTVFHIMLSGVTFLVLCAAAFLAILLLVQERFLRYQPQGLLINKLPPLESMETLLFQVIILGFILLSILLSTSFYFYHALLFSDLKLIPKTIISLSAWWIFLILLISRYRFGLRGRKAIYYTLVGVILILLAYVGSAYFSNALMR